MSGYEDSASAKMLATHCAACGRSLVDAESVEAGMGPDCRERYLVVTGIADEFRHRANQVVYAIASNPKDGFAALKGAAELKALGFAVLADRITQRAAKVVISIEHAPGGDSLVLASPYSPEATAAFRAIRGRRWDEEAEVNRFPLAAKPYLWDALLKHFPGALAMGPSGPFVIAKPAPKAEVA